MPRKRRKKAPLPSTNKTYVAVLAVCLFSGGFAWMYFNSIAVPNGNGNGNGYYGLLSLMASLDGTYVSASLDITYPNGSQQSFSTPFSEQCPTGLYAVTCTYMAEEQPHSFSLGTSGFNYVFQFTSSGGDDFILWIWGDSHITQGTSGTTTGINDMNNLAEANYVVAMGDLTQWGYETEYQSLMGLTSTSIIPFSNWDYVIGNHDRWNSGTPYYEGGGEQFFFQYCQHEMFYARTIGNIRMIFLGCEYADNQVIYTSAAYNFLEAEIAGNQHRIVMVFSEHHIIHPHDPYRARTAEQEQLRQLTIDFRVDFWIYAGLHRPHHPSLPNDWKFQDTTGTWHINIQSIAYIVSNWSGFDRGSESTVAYFAQGSNVVDFRTRLHASHVWGSHPEETLTVTLPYNFQGWSS